MLLTMSSVSSLYVGPECAPSCTCTETKTTSLSATLARRDSVKYHLMAGGNISMLEMFLESHRCSHIGRRKIVATTSNSLAAWSTFSLSPSSWMLVPETSGGSESRGQKTIMREAKALQWHPCTCTRPERLPQMDQIMQAWMVLTPLARVNVVPALLICVSGKGLSLLGEATFMHHFQISPENPMVGVSSRVRLLNDVGAALLKWPDHFGPTGRPGHVVGKCGIMVKEGNACY